MGNCDMEEEDIVFKKPYKDMKNHLKPLFVHAKVDRVGMNKVLVDGGATFNLMRHFLLKKKER